MKPDILKKVDFSYREEFKIDEASLPQAVELMFKRAKALLRIIADIHIETHINQIDGEQIAWVIETITRELDDISAVIDAYSREW
jgi:hypothetical protein